jgi:hypothetical protein
MHVHNRYLFFRLAEALAEINEKLSRSTDNDIENKDRFLDDDPDSGYSRDWMEWSSKKVQICKSKLKVSFS